MSRLTRYGWLGDVGFGVATAVMITSATTFIWYASNGASVLTVFPFCWLAWVSYLVAHYLVTGDAADASATEPRSSTLSETVVSAVHRSSTRQLVLALGGGTSMILAFPTGIVAVHRNVFSLLLFGHVLFIGGYVVGHQGITGKPL